MTAIILISAVAMFAVAIVVTRVIEHALTSRLELWAAAAENEPDQETELELDEQDVVLVTPPPIPMVLDERDVVLVTPPPIPRVLRAAA